MPTALVSSTSQIPPPEELLQYLSLYKVIICTSCEYAIQPKAIARHLKEIHRMKLSDRQPFMQHVSKFELADHELVLQYVPKEFPVPFLPVQSGLRCRSDACTYLCQAEKRIKHHWISVHGRNGVVGWDWEVVPLQTFFRGNLLRYFTETPSGTAIEVMAASKSQKITDEWMEKALEPSFYSPQATTTLFRTVDQSDNLLMQHFTTHTWQTLANDENMRQMWRDTVPKLAYQHGYLMQALLACAALHKAFLRPDQQAELTLKARTHQDLAIPLFLSAISNVESETCDAVLVFVRLVGITAFALDETLFTTGEKEDKLPSWLFFIRSGCTMFCDVWDRMGTGPVRYLTESWELLVQISSSPHPALLEYFLTIPSDHAWPAAVRLPYNESALALAQNFSCLSALDERITTLEVVRFWPIKNSVEFVELLGNWHPGALILLAYYCIVLHRMSARSWSLGGTAASMLATIVKRLEGTWIRYIEWPLREVGVTVTTRGVGDELATGSLAISGNEAFSNEV